MTSLCGHDRGALIWALQLVCAEDDSAHNVPPYPMRSQPKFVRRVDDAIHDPAKLAEMLAARGRELDVERWEFAEWAGKVLCCFRRKLGAKVQESDTRELQPAQARAILLQWLQLPDGAREEAERALRGET